MPVDHHADVHETAQATDVGVNKATRPLFAVADSPEKMLALGEEKVPNYPTAWLPTARVAERWQWLVTEKP